MTSTDIMRKVAEVAPAKYSFFTKTAKEVQKSPFRDEIMSELDTLIKKATFQKTANPGLLSRLSGGFKAGLGSMAGPAAGIGGVVAAGVAASLAGDMYDALKRGITKGRDYRSMMAENPDLSDLDAKHVQKAFSVLHKFNPDFAGDPTVAGNFVRQQATLENQAFDTRQLSEIIGSRAHLTNLKKLPIPGRVPWETGEERKGRDLQNTQLMGNIAQTQQKMVHDQSDEKRKSESHKANMKKAPEDLRNLQLKNNREEFDIARSSAEDSLQGRSIPNLGLRARRALGLR
jgi:hypothetical protein